ncbi:hypothetical protein RSOL_257590 [Rhizoctonia solani AG-3 Rhs1AP]|uniref:Uncharacterized protein n=1 Tax=Rhizoctonia solani AG-3 Rhs1AP TaxID=1086054 RepID=A0A0A1UHT0_9AGAM|nr:hypothetical protein RSOL_257590 [Rhizoctonia solani AG-3 Rhs1AP]
MPSSSPLILTMERIIMTGNVTFLMPATSLPFRGMSLLSTTRSRSSGTQITTQLRTLVTSGSHITTITFCTSILVFPRSDLALGKHIRSIDNTSINCVLGTSTTTISRTF